MFDILLKYNTSFINSRRLVIKTDQNRMDVMMCVCEELGGVYKSIDPHSSIGCIDMESCRIYVKPLRSPGIDNETLFVNTVQQYLDSGCDTLKFGRTILRDVISVQHVGGDKNKENRKADVLIHTKHRTVPISIKKVNAERWASVDSMYGKEAKKLLKTSVENGIIELSDFSDDGKIKRLSSPIARKLSNREINKVVFGSDIRKEKGFVIVKSFCSDDFVLKKGVLHINGNIIKKPDDIKDTAYHPYMMIRNDAARKSKHLPYGVRVEIVYESRITTNTVLADKE